MSPIDDEVLLHIHIDVRLGDEQWGHDVHVPVPPDYHDVDIEPFILHEVDKATGDFEEDNFHRNRMAEIVAQYATRIRVIRYLIQNAPHPVRTSPVAQKIREVMDLDNAELYARWGNRDEVEE